MFDELNVSLPINPITHSWHSASRVLSKNELDVWEFANKFVTRAEYEEHGVAICRKRFRNYWLDGEEFVANNTLK